MANEKRLIDANDIWKKTFVCDEVAEVRKFIENAPTVDAVEVVRCKNCGCWMKDDPGDNFGYCINPDGLDNYAKPDDFCSYGERRTDDRETG